MQVDKEEKMLKKHRKEQRELSRLLKEQGRSAYLHSFFFVLLILTVIYIADEIMTNTGTMKPYMIFDLFNIRNQDINDPAYAKAISMMAVATIPTNIITIINPLYRSLADRFGRKPFLVLNILGMALGITVCMLSTSVYAFVVGTCILDFFSPNDMQVIYLMETAPKAHRAKMCSITKGISLLSVSLVGVFKTMFYDPEVLSSWRFVYIIPIAIAVVISILAAIFTKESPVFLERRIAYLRKTDEEREEDRKQASTGKGSLAAALRFIIHDKQVRTIAIVLLIFATAQATCGYTTEIMLAPGHLTDADMNLFFIIQPIVFAVFSFLSGFVLDRAGRKNGGFFFGIIAIVCFMLFVFGASAGLSAVALAFIFGLMRAGFWSLSDLLYVMLPAESAPTSIRASVMALISYTYATCVLMNILLGVFFTKIGAARIGILEVCLFVPAVLISILFLKFRLRETRDVDLTAVGKEE